VRFGIVERGGGVTRVRWVRERDHHPFDDGVLELRDGDGASQGSVLERQARAYVASYLRRLG
jgi:hypothetical protein